MSPDELRIGDRERDEAIGWLREHHSTGRLDGAEFDDRMSRALQARTRRDLEQLFLDLPEPKPSAGGTAPNPYSAPSPYEAPPAYGQPYGQDPYGSPQAGSYGADPYTDPYSGASFAPAPYGSTPYDPTYQQNPYAPSPMAPGAGEPQYRQPPTPWYAQWWMLLAAVGFSAMTGARLGWLIPLMAVWIWVGYPQIAKSQAQKTPPRELDYLERSEILREVREGRRVHAVKRYREMTGADLVTAKHAVDAMVREIGH